MSTNTASGTSKTSTRSFPTTHPLAESDLSLGRQLLISKRLSWLPLPILTICSHRGTDEYKAVHGWPQGIPKTEYGYPAELGIEEIMSTSFQLGKDWSPLSGLACNIDYERAVSALEEECDRIQTIISAHRIDRHVNDKTDTKSCDSTIGTIEDFRGTRLLAHMRPAVLSVRANLHRSLDEAAKKGLTDDMEEDVESVVKSVFALDAKVMEPWTGDDGTMFHADQEIVRKAKALGNFDMAIADMTERRAGHPVSLMSRLQIIESGWQHHRVEIPTEETAIDQDSRDELARDITEGILGKWPNISTRPGGEDKTDTVLASIASTGQGC